MSLHYCPSLCGRVVVVYLQNKSLRSQKTSQVEWFVLQIPEKVVWSSYSAVGDGWNGCWMAIVPAGSFVKRFAHHVSKIEDLGIATNGGPRKRHPTTAGTFNLVLKVSCVVWLLKFHVHGRFIVLLLVFSAVDAPISKSDLEKIATEFLAPIGIKTLLMIIEMASQQSADGRITYDEFMRCAADTGVDLKYIWNVNRCRNLQCDWTTFRNLYATYPI